LLPPWFVCKAPAAKFFAFNPTISTKEETEHENILYYYPEEGRPCIHGIPLPRSE